jgi:hypothetical protein
MHLIPTALALFESSDNVALAANPINQVWLTMMAAVSGPRLEVLARRYYLALQHFRRPRRRPAPQGRATVVAAGRKAAQVELLKVWSEPAGGTFVQATHPGEPTHLPPALRDMACLPPSLQDLCRGPGRPPCDAMAMMRAFLAAPLLGVGDDCTSVHRLLHSNPSYARACGFDGRGTRRRSSELTSRRTPSLATLQEFDEVMARYGLWQQARLDQVRDNVRTGVVQLEDTLVFDTTHVEANSHCGQVAPPAPPVAPSDTVADAQGGKAAATPPKKRKTPRMRKWCDCGSAAWETCEHPWSPTDQGAAVVVKGATRIYWAHKQSIMSLGRSEIPLDVRVLQYAAENDGKTLLPHLEVLQRDLPEVLEPVRFILADDAYGANRGAVGHVGQGARLIGPIHPLPQERIPSARRWYGLDYFTPTGVPVCEGGHRFDFRGRDVAMKKFIWTAPDTAEGKSVCGGCPQAWWCLDKGQRRLIRVDRHHFPAIDWEHPQHAIRHQARYRRRSGVERAIKRLKVDLGAQILNHRDGHRVQAHFDRRLLTLHMLLAFNSA